MDTKSRFPLIPTSLKKLGKRAPVIDKRTFRLSKYLCGVLPPPPKFSSFIEDVPSWPMLLNDQLGDCVIAAGLHMEQQWSFFAKEKLGANKPVFTPTDAQALQLYEAIAGYNPNDPNSDQGTDMLTALKYWRKTGFAGHKILAFASVDPTNKAEWQVAMALFGNLFIGLALPYSAQAQMDNNLPFTVPNGGPFQSNSPGGLGGHCVPAMAYSDKSITMVTWGQTWKMSHNFFADYCDEAFCVLSQDWLDNKGRAPSHLNLTQLKADLQLL